MCAGALAACAILIAPAGASALVTPASTAPSGRQLQLVLPLVGNQSGLTRFAESVSTPGSPGYRQYRSVAWLARHFGASITTRRRVVGYLRAHGARDVRVDVSAQFVFARLAVENAERVFGTSLSDTRIAGVTRFVAPATPVTLPAALRGLVTGVVGLDSAPVATGTLDDTSPATTGDAPAASSGYAGPDPTATASGCPAGIAARGFTPNEYLDAYDYAPLQQQGLLGQGERVAVIEIDGFRSSDLAQFASCFDLRRPKVKAFTSGTPKLSAPGGEATLDLEVLDAAAPGLESIDVYETQPDAADVLVAIAQPLQNQALKPQVISVSLGLCESSTVAGVGMIGVRAIETALKLAAAEGISVLGASGDLGSSDCVIANSTPPRPQPKLAVNFPSSSPWVTSVGGTNLNLNAQNQIVSQTVWNDAGVVPGNATGGGSSHLFARPSWQDGLVAGGGRAQPDVAMLADVAPGYDVYCTASQDCKGRGWQTFGGTSASTPLMAGGFALVDQLLREHARQSLGLADPLLYRFGRNSTTAAQVFDDVTSGSNDVGPFTRPSQQPLGCCSARAGYDQASGWGGVNLQGFANAALAAVKPLANLTAHLPGGQKPAQLGVIRVWVHCSAACAMGAYARVTVHRAGGATTVFTDYATPVRFAAAAGRTLTIALSTPQRNEVATALFARERVTAAVAGAVISGGAVARHSAPLALAITGV